MDVKNYDSVFQKYILNQVLNTPDVFVRCKNILKPEYFDKSFQQGVGFALEYSMMYDTLPTIENIKVKTGTELEEVQVSPLHHQAILNDVAEYCRHKALENAIIEGTKLVQLKRYGEIEQLVKEAMLVSLQTDMGLDLYKDPETVIASLAGMQGNFKSGWETLDYKLFGGFGKQELEIFAAASGGGKSVVLQNLAVNFSRQGKRGVYITLELAEELVSVRIYSMLIDKAPNAVKGDIDDSVAKIKIQERSNGKLLVKRMPESITTVNDIEAYLRELQIKTGEKLDYICVDYLDLLTSDRCTDKGNAFLKDKFVSEELRALAMKMDITVFTACQFNRSGIDETTKSQSQIAGGISKIYTADNVIYIDAHKDRGEMIFDFQKTRNSSAVGSRLKMSYNIDTLRVKDHQESVDQLMQFGFKPTNVIDIGNANCIRPPNSTGGMSVANQLKKDLSAGKAPSMTSPSLESSTSKDPVLNNNTIRDFLNRR